MALSKIVFGTVMMFASVVALVFLLSNPAPAGSLDRVGAQVVGEATWVPAIMFVSPTVGKVVVTTDAFAKGRDLGSVQVVPAGMFDPTDVASSVAFIRAQYGEPADVSLGGSVNAILPGPDGIRGTPDDQVERDSDRF